MAGSEEARILEGVSRMALKEGSGAVERVNGKEFATEIVFRVVSEIKNTSGDLSVVEMEVAAMIEMMRKLMMDKAKQFTRVGEFRLSIFKDGTPFYTGNLAPVIDEVHKDKTSKAPVETGKAAAVIDEILTEKMVKAPVEAVAAIGKIQTEKMDKAPVEGEKNQFSAMTREAPVETLKQAVDIDKYRLPADYVRSILAVPRETLLEDIPYLQVDNLAKLMGVTEEWLEEERRLYKEEAARMQRISNDFLLFQNKVREEFDRKGYVEVDEEYLTNAIKMQEFSNELWKDQDWSGIEFSDRDDPDYACWYENCEPEPREGLCSVK